MAMMMLLAMMNFSESVIVPNHSLNHNNIHTILYIEKAVDSKVLLDYVGCRANISVWESVEKVFVETNGVWVNF